MPINGVEIAQRAKEQLALLTGLVPDTVSKLSKNNDTWHVAVDMIELKCVPNTKDVLAIYAITLDEQGNMLEYQRIKRYVRGQVAEER